VKNEISKRNLQKEFRKNLVVEIRFLKISQPTTGENNFGKNTVAEPSFPDKKKKDCR
jgi:hypothetical protein